MLPAPRSQRAFPERSQGPAPKASLTGPVRRRPPPRLLTVLSRFSLPVPNGDCATSLTSLDIQGALNRDLFANALIQWDNLSKELQANIRIDWIHPPGSDLFLVLEPGYFGDDDLDPRHEAHPARGRPTPARPRPERASLQPAGARVRRRETLRPLFTQLRPLFTQLGSVIHPAPAAIYPARMRYLPSSDRLFTQLGSAIYPARIRYLPSSDPLFAQLGSVISPAPWRIAAEAQPPSRAVPEPGEPDRRSDRADFPALHRPKSRLPDVFPIRGRGDRAGAGTGCLARLLPPNPLFTQLRPLFTQLRPLFTQLRPLFTQLQPLFTQLQPLFTQLRPLFAQLAALFPQLAGLDRGAAGGPPGEPARSARGRGGCRRSIEWAASKETETTWQPRH